MRARALFYHGFLAARCIYNLRSQHLTPLKKARVCVCSVRASAAHFGFPLLFLVYICVFIVFIVLLWYRPLLPISILISRRHALEFSCFYYQTASICLYLYSAAAAHIYARAILINIESPLYWEFMSCVKIENARAI